MNITREEFDRFVIPHVRALGYWPEGYSRFFDKEIADNIWRWTQDERATDWSVESSLRDTFGTLNLDARYIAIAVRRSIASFLIFKEARQRGHRKVRVCSRNQCGETAPEEISLDDMSNAYRNPWWSSLLVPFPRCPLNGKDGWLCNCTILLGLSPPRPGQDGSFSEWLERLWKGTKT